VKDGIASIFRKQELVLLFCPEEEESSFLQNFGNDLPDYTESYSSNQ
jgi:hypothetical protein